MKEENILNDLAFVTGLINETRFILTPVEYSQFHKSFRNLAEYIKEKENETEKG